MAGSDTGPLYKQSVFIIEWGQAGDLEQTERLRACQVNVKLWLSYSEKGHFNVTVRSTWTTIGMSKKMDA